VKKMPDGMLASPLGISVDRSAFKNQSNKLADIVTKNPGLSRMFFEEMKHLLIEQQLDLDYLSVEALLGILAHRKTMKSELEKLARILS
jgi:Fe-S oxidoreductase